MSHIVNSCPLTKFDGGLLRLHEADEAAIDWLTTYGSLHTLIIIIPVILTVVVLHGDTARMTTMENW